MIRHVKSRVLLVLIAMVVTLNGCTSYNAVKVSNQSLSNSTYFLTEPPLYTGDKIRYQLKDGEKGDMTVARLTPQAIVGQNGMALHASDIISLEKQEFSGTKTGAAVGGGVAATTVVIMSIVCTSIVSSLMAGIAAG